MRRLLLFCFVFTWIGCAPTPAQVIAQQVLTEYDVLLEREAVHAGTPLRGVLRVPLPDGLHLQSNAPREAGLIPTELTFAPPDGIRIDEVVFPPSIDLPLPGYTFPLAVFEHELLLGVVIAVDATRAPGPVTIPSRLRYQACDDRQCFRPRDLDVSWQFTVVESTAALPPRATGTCWAACDSVRAGNRRSWTPFPRQSGRPLPSPVRATPPPRWRCSTSSRFAAPGPT